MAPSAFDSEGRIKCPKCKGKGTYMIPGLKNGEWAPKQKPCNKCKGTGKLIIVKNHG